MSRFIILAALALSAATAQAQAPCMPHPGMVKALPDRHGESQRVVGVGDRAIMEVYENADTGTWTVLVTGTNGLACIRASGKGGVMINAQVEPDEGT